MATSPKRPAVPPRAQKPRIREDLNQLAFRIVAEATGAVDRTPDPDTKKSPKAVVRGRKGGTKGGPARAAKLTPAKRTEIARKAAKARWG